MIRAAGILLLTKDNKALFLKRGLGGDYPGAWCFPGGRMEEGETSIAAAIRETKEEAGYKAKTSQLVPWTRRISAVPAVSMETPPGVDSPQTPEMAGTPEEIDFQTFLAKDIEEFVPELGPVSSSEHVAFAWAPIDQPPQPLHPGCQIALDKFNMKTELAVAQAIQAGELTSPQKYSNIYLFALRITGTGRAFRHEEIVWRDPSLYLNPEFLERCAGLPVILEHPPGLTLNSKEYKDRNIGSIMRAYILGDEVWGIARILDEAAAKMMTDTQLSTSPGVAWSDPDANIAGKLESGKRFLIEDKPSLLDHLAVCWQGVWDKGLEPAGVLTVRGDEDMATEAELAKQAAEQAARLEALMTSVTGLSEGVKAMVARQDAIDTENKAIKARLDAEEKEKEEEKKADARKRADAFEFSKRKDDDDDDSLKKRHDEEEKACADAEEEAGEKKEAAADKAKKRRHDAEEKDEKERKDAKARKDAAEEEEKKKNDAARKDSIDPAAFAEMKAKLELLEGKTKPRTDDEVNQFGKVQYRADSIYSALGQRARGPMLGESLIAYRRHFLNDLKQYSPTWKDQDLTVVAADEGMLTKIEEIILNEALASARSPAAMKAGELRMETIRHDSGHIERRFHAQSPAVWMNEFAGPVKQAAKKFKDEVRSDR